MVMEVLEVPRGKKKVGKMREIGLLDASIVVIGVK